MTRFNATMFIFVLVLALNGVGLMMIYSSSAPIAASQINARNSARAKVTGETFEPIAHHPKFLYKQLVWLGLGVAALMFLYRRDYDTLLKYSRYFWILSLILIGIVLAFMPAINESKRWLILGPFTFQPSELAKLSLVVLTAKMLDDRKTQLHSLTRGFFKPVLLAVLTCAVIAIQDLGSAVVIGLVCFTMWFFAGLRYRHILALIPIGLVGGVVGVLMEPYRINRLRVWLFGGDELDGAWQITQSLIAVGSGGLKGLGLGMGIQKYHFVAAMYTDFIFADICEELGFIGAVALLLLFATLITLGFVTAFRCPDFVGMILAAGMTTMIALPVLINVAVVLQMGPTKGLPLPFISYGGSSLLVNMCAVGILMNIAERNAETQGVYKRDTVTRERRLFRWGRASRAY
jgi:cell division protein FtsW